MFLCFQNWLLNFTCKDFFLLLFIFKNIRSTVLIWISLQKQIANISRKYLVTFLVILKGIWWLLDISGFAFIWDFLEKMSNFSKIVNILETFLLISIYFHSTQWKLIFLEQFFMDFGYFDIYYADNYYRWCEYHFPLMIVNFISKTVVDHWSHYFVFFHINIVRSTSCYYYWSLSGTICCVFLWLHIFIVKLTIQM